MRNEPPKRWRPFERSPGSPRHDRQWPSRRSRLSSLRLKRTIAGADLIQHLANRGLGALAHEVIRGGTWEVYQGRLWVVPAPWVIE